MPKETESLILGARFIHLSGQPCSLTLGHGDRGCPDCGKVAAEAAVYIVDARDRYWCASCAADALGEITRRTEDRPDARYRWDFPDHMFDLRRRAARGEEGAIVELRSLQVGFVNAIEHPRCQAVLRAQCLKLVDHVGPHHNGTACFGVDANVSVDLKVERKIKDRSARPIVWEHGTRWHATAWRLGVPFDDDDDIAEPCLETTDFHDRPEMALIQLADIIWERRGKAKNGGGS